MGECLDKPFLNQKEIEWDSIYPDRTHIIVGGFFADTLWVYVRVPISVLRRAISDADKYIDKETRDGRESTETSGSQTAA